jgi:putative ATP-dependent endonuclease of OLD family
MFLSTLTVNNFRGILAAKINFDDTTIFIGENDCGKTSLFDALAIALTDTEEKIPRFEPQHFHRHQGDLSQTPVGDILIELVFEELNAGDWNQLELLSLASLLPAASGQPRRLTLQIAASPEHTESAVNGSWTIFGTNEKKSINELNILSDLRRLNPLIWLRGSTLLGITANNKCDVNLSPPADIAPLVKEIEKHYHALVTGDTRQTHDDIKAGYKAARALLARRATNIVSAGSLMHPMISDILGERDHSEYRALQTHHGSAALQTGIFILTAALLSYFTNNNSPGAEPTLLLEDPETNLHLMTLASVWSLLKHIKAQKIITTQSGTLLAATPLHKVRRLTRYKGVLKQWYVRKNKLPHEELRKLSYHVRVRRGSASFARCWLLVEGETEFWVLPELAVISGYDFNIEGIAVVEFAQCGLAPLIKLAQEWGIEWHVLCDGDKAGGDYAETASHYIEPGDELTDKITLLKELDIEHCFWIRGYKDVFARAANKRLLKANLAPASSIINRAIKRHSKPYLAFEIIQAVSAEHSPGVPGVLKKMIEICVDLARNAPRRKTEMPAGNSN